MSFKVLLFVSVAVLAVFAAPNDLGTTELPESSMCVQPECPTEWNFEATLLPYISDCTKFVMCDNEGRGEIR